MTSVLPTTTTRAEAGEAPTTLVVRAAEHKVEYAELRLDTGQVLWRWPHRGPIGKAGALVDLTV